MGVEKAGGGVQVRSVCVRWVPGMLLVQRARGLGVDVIFLMHF